MRVDDIERETELQRVLWACYKYWESEPVPVDQRTICYNWVIRPFEKAFGSRFRQSRLQHLTKLGFLKQAGTSRGGHRRYYAIVNPERVAELLKEWNLN